MVVTVAGAGVSSTPFNPQFGGLGGVNGGALAGGSQVIYNNMNDLGTQSNWDWTNPDYAWADDIHFKDNDTLGWVITAINYAYLNQGKGQSTVTHTVRIYDMLDASASHAPGSAQTVGMQLSVINLPSLAGVGAFTVLITGLSIEVGHAVWISLDESPGNAGRTFWTTGGIPTVGSSHDTIGYFNHGVYYSITNSPFGGEPLANSAITVSGFKIPGPSVIALLGLGGLVTLSRRRRK